MQPSLGVLLPNLICNFRLTTATDSYLAINKTIRIRMFLGTVIYLKTCQIKTSDKVLQFYEKNIEIS